MIKQFSSAQVASEALPVPISWLHFGGAKEIIQKLGFAVVCHVVFSLGSLPDSGTSWSVYVCRSN